MDSIQPQIESLSSNINELENALLPIIKTALSSTTSKLPLLDKAKLYVLATYAIESILFSYLRLNGVDAKAHPVFQELTRVKEYFNKIKTAETAGVGSKNKLDKSAAGRFIKAGLSGNDKYDAERKDRQEREKAGAKRKLESMSTGTHTRFDAVGQAAEDGEKIAVVRASELSGDEEPGSVGKEGPSKKKKKSKKSKRQSDQGESTDVVMSGEVDDLEKDEPMPDATTNETNDDSMPDAAKALLNWSRTSILNQSMHSPERACLAPRDVVQDEIRIEEDRADAQFGQRMTAAAAMKQKRMLRQAESVDVARSGILGGGEDIEGLADTTKQEQGDPARWTGEKARQFRNLSSMLNTYTLAEVADWESRKLIQGGLDAVAQTALVHRRAAVLTDEERAQALLDDLDRMLGRKKREVMKTVPVPSTTQSNMRHGGLRPGDPSHGAVLGFAAANGRIFRTEDEAQKVGMLAAEPVELSSVALYGRRYDGVNVDEPSIATDDQCRSKTIKTEDGAQQSLDRHHSFYNCIDKKTENLDFARDNMYAAADGDDELTAWSEEHVPVTGQGQALNANLKNVTKQKQKQQQKQQRKSVHQSKAVHDNRDAASSSRDDRRIDGKVAGHMASSPGPWLQKNNIDAIMHAHQATSHIQEGRQAPALAKGSPIAGDAQGSIVDSVAMLDDVKSRIAASITGHLEHELAAELNRLKSQYGWSNEDIQALPVDKLDMAAYIEKLGQPAPLQAEMQENRPFANDQSRPRSLEDIFRRVVPLEKREAARRRGMTSDARFQLFTSIGQDMAELNGARIRTGDRAMLQKLDNTRDVLWTQLKQLKLCRVPLSEAMRNGIVVVDLPGGRPALQDIFLRAVKLGKAENARRAAMHPDEKFVLFLKAGRDMAELINHRSNTSEIERIREIDRARNALVKQTMILGPTPRQLADALRTGTLIVVGEGSQAQIVEQAGSERPQPETMYHSNDQGSEAGRTSGN